MSPLCLYHPLNIDVIKEIDHVYIFLQPCQSGNFTIVQNPMYMIQYENLCLYLAPGAVPRQVGQNRSFIFCKNRVRQAISVIKPYAVLALAEPTLPLCHAYLTQFQCGTSWTLEFHRLHQA